MIDFHRLAVREPKVAARKSTGVQINPWFPSFALSVKERRIAMGTACIVLERRQNITYKLLFRDDFFFFLEMRQFPTAIYPWVSVAYQCSVCVFKHDTMLLHIGYTCLQVERNNTPSPPTPSLGLFFFIFFLFLSFFFFFFSSVFIYFLFFLPPCHFVSLTLSLFLPLSCILLYPLWLSLSYFFSFSTPSSITTFYSIINTFFFYSLYF